MVGNLLDINTGHVMNVRMLNDWNILTSIEYEQVSLE